MLGISFFVYFWIMNNLRITTIQSALHWENVDANLEAFDLKLRTLDPTDLIILPETFTTGFSMNAEQIAEPMDGKAMQWLAKQAAEHQAVVTGSFIAKDGGKFYNRLIWMRPDSSYEIYDKHHLFTLAGEHKVYTPGEKKLIVELNGWKICPMVCYDLRFPAWARNMEDYDLLFYVANWPETRAFHWKSLLIARAIENQCYLAGVNRVGTDENGLVYSGDSTVIDYNGRNYFELTGEEGVFTSELDYDELHKFRSKLNFLADRDNVVL